MSELLKAGRVTGHALGLTEYEECHEQLHGRLSRIGREAAAVDRNRAGCPHGVSYEIHG
jgi:hypothetical protein